MASRLELHKLLMETLGSKNVYFQPPESVKIQYPCIIYERNRGKDFRANDLLYNYRKSYTLTMIDSNPDSEIPDRLLYLPFVAMDRHFKSDNLNHWTFTIYY